MLFGFGLFGHSGGNGTLSRPLKKQLCAGVWTCFLEKMQKEWSETHPKVAWRSFDEDCLKSLTVSVIVQVFIRNKSAQKEAPQCLSHMLRKPLFKSSLLFLPIGSTGINKSLRSIELGHLMRVLWLFLSKIPMLSKVQSVPQISSSSNSRSVNSSALAEPVLFDFPNVSAP